MFRKLLLAIGLAIAIVYALTFAPRTRIQANNTDGARTHYLVAQRHDVPPDRVLYNFLFRHLGHLKKQADKHQRLGKDGSGFQRRFKNVLVIDDDQFESLNKIALNCEAEVAKIDKRAEAIIDAFRTQYPSGEIPEGVVIPPPPPELLALQEERYRAVLRARDRVREALGEQEFKRFDEIVKMRLAPDIKQTNPSH